MALIDANASSGLISPRIVQHRRRQIAEANRGRSKEDRIDLSEALKPDFSLHRYPRTNQVSPVDPDEPAKASAPVIDKLRHPKSWETEDLGRTDIDPTKTLESFIVDAENRLAFAAVQKLVSLDDKLVSGINPLVLVGGSGLGKSHLAHAFANELADRSGIFLEPSHFMGRLVGRARNPRYLDHLAPDALIIEDLHCLRGQATMRCLDQLIKDSLSRRIPIFVSSQEDFWNADQFPPVVKHRLGSGLCVHIGSPDVSTCIQIARDTAKRQIGEQCEELFPDSIVEYLVKFAGKNPRQVVQAVERTCILAQATGKTPSLKIAEQALRSLLVSLHVKQPKIEEIKETVATHFGLSIIDLESARRTRTVVFPRQVAMFLCKTLTPRSLPEIGRRFGNRDHTTVLHAARKIGGLLDQPDQQALRDDVASIQARLGVSAHGEGPV